MIQSEHELLISSNQSEKCSKCQENSSQVEKRDNPGRETHLCILIGLGAVGDQVSPAAEICLNTAFQQSFIKQAGNMN